MHTVEYHALRHRFMGRGAIRGLRQPGQQPEAWQSHESALGRRRAKQRVVDAVLSTFRNGKWPRAQDSALLKPGSITWQDICGHRHLYNCCPILSSPSSPAFGRRTLLRRRGVLVCGLLADAVAPDGEAVPEWFRQGNIFSSASPLVP